jgi:ATP-dependent Clp protease ATP-binding subunit ClpC
MTSNIGARDIKDLGKGFGFAQEPVDFNYASMKSTVEDALKRVFNPEFLNRVDDVIVFRPLEKKHILGIIEIMVEELFARVEDLGIEIKLNKTAKEFLVDKGFDVQFGARPLRRAIQKYVEDPMAEAILASDLGEGDKITIGVKGSDDEKELSFKTKKGEPKKPEKKKEEPDEPTGKAEDSGKEGSASSGPKGKSGDGNGSDQETEAPEEAEAD